MRRRIPPSLTKYLYRTCPKCKSYLGVVVPDTPDPMKVIQIDAYCGFKLLWKVVLGKKSSLRSASTALFLLTVFGAFYLTLYSLSTGTNGMIRREGTSPWGAASFCTMFKPIR